MTATGNASVVAQRIMEIIETVREDLQLGGILYGDHFKIPFNRTICVVADTKRRELRNMPRGAENTFNTSVLVYHGSIEDVQQNLLDCDQLAEAIEEKIHEYPRLTDPNDPADTEGLVYHSLVRVSEPGTRTRAGNTQWKVHKLTVESQSLTRLPSL